MRFLISFVRSWLSASVASSAVRALRNASSAMDPVPWGRLSQCPVVHFVIPQLALRQPALRQLVLRVLGLQRYSLVTAEPRQYGPNTCWDMSTSPNPLSIVASVPWAAAPATVAP